jgi:hypothetical protein
MTLTMEDIRARYPNPISAKTLPRPTEGYCIGGGVVCFSGFAYDEFKFPSGLTIANTLQVLNPALDAVDAARYAKQIMCDNDDERFASAWAGVEAALKEVS